MKTFKLLKCWPNADPNSSTVADTDAVPYFDSIKNLIYGMDYLNNSSEEILYDDDSFFDLVFTGPDGSPKIACHSKSAKQGKSGGFDSHSKSHSPVTVLGSGIKFRVFFFGFRKSNSEKTGIDDSSTVNPKHHNKRSFPRDNSLRSKLEKEFSVEESSSKQFARAAELAKFLKMVKRRNSKMCIDKIRPSYQVSTPIMQCISSSRKQLEEKQRNRVAVFGAVCKHVMKSRTAPPSSFTGVSSAMNRRDDSLLEQNDGILGAILHCKRSYSTASKGTYSVYFFCSSYH